jgi:NTP pyrophosphatase (non-canonical NTP hydrolase)
MTDPDLDALAGRLRRFAAERGWHAIDTPHNLAVAVLVESAELLEHFQWLDEAASARLPEAKLREAELEMADVLIFLLRLADTLGIDPMTAARRKLDINAARYPADRARGRAAKYTEL